MTGPLISVLVLNWNGAGCLPRCLDALARQTYPDFEVLVLDNASTDGSADGVEQRWPGFRLVRFERNLGFAAGNNRGAALAKGRWLAFLNNDAFPEPDWLAGLAQAAAEYPEYAFFASRLISAANPQRVQATGDVLHASGAAWSRDNGLPADQAQRPMEEVFSASAAAAMYARQAFQDAGGFTEAFGSHLEDVDLGFRLRLRGERCLYVPAAVAAHVGGASYGVESERTVYQVQRNLVWLYWADMPARLFWKHLPAHLLANLIFLAHYTLRGRAKAAWRAKLDALRCLPGTLQRRRQIQSQRRVAPEEIERLLDRGLASPYLLGKRGARLRRIFGAEPGMES
jgi:GT2 family glycosyltransferase